MSHTFLTLCEELATLQLQLLRREGSPKSLSRQALRLIRENLSCVALSKSNSAGVPTFLRSCGSLLKEVPEQDELLALDVLDHSFHLAKEYVHLQRNVEINEECSLLRALINLEECYTNYHNKNSPDQNLPLFNQYTELLVPAFDRSIIQLRQNPNTAHTLSILTLLQATSKVYGNNFVFHSSTADIRSLLPIKTKIQMEAKVQRCVGVRDLMNHLHMRELNRLDAGMCLSIMADTGFYDGEVCNVCCSVLHASSPLLTSPQLCQIIHSLGVLQHRHVHQKFFSSLIEPKKCTADGIKKHVQGLAMLQQPPPSEVKLMDGIFLHCLRDSHQPFRDSVPPRTEKRQHLRYNEPSIGYELPPLWYIDVGHSLAALNLTHQKYKLTTARQARRSIAKLSTLERCKLLYAVGGVPAENVAENLRSSWKGKVERIISITVEKLNHIQPEDGPKVMNALMFCGIHDHVRIPKVVPRRSDENPVDLLLKTWSTSPRERVLELAEKIETSHFGSNPSRKISNLVSTVANSFDTALGEEEQSRLGGLRAAVQHHAPSMTVPESLNVLEGLGKMGVSGEEASESLLQQMWKERRRMVPSERARCRDIVRQLKPSPIRNDLLEFTSQH